MILSLRPTSLAFVSTSCHRRFHLSPDTGARLGPERSATKKHGAEIIWECLERLGVKCVFGYPGGAILPTYDAMTRYSVHHVLVRHEQGATHMADGYARASGNVGVALATSGPGATNMVTGIATAMMDSSPIVCITGQVGSKLIGSDAFQETDITGITLADHKTQLPRHARRKTSPRPFAKLFRSPRPAVPGPCWLTSPRTRKTVHAHSTGTPPRPALAVPAPARQRRIEISPKHFI